MSKIKLIVEIEKRTYELIKDKPDNIAESIIANGTPYNPTGDAISRDELKKCAIPCQIHNGALTELCVPLYQIDSVPSVPLPDFKDGYKQAIIDGKTNFSRQEGEWINHRNDYGHNIADCSLCGKTMQWHDEDEDGVPRYCWYCGAPMKGVKKNEITFDDYLKEQLKDPEFRKEWEKLLDEEKKKGDAE